MTRTDTHPSFEQARPDRRWRSGSLPDLWAVLNQEANARPGRWAKRVLPGGAHVSLRIVEGVGRRELVLYRSEPFRTEGGESAWSAEVLTFARKFGVLSWAKEPGHAPGGGPLMTLREQAAQDSFFEGG